MRGMLGWRGAGALLFSLAAVRAADTGGTIRSDSNLVLIGATVLDGRDRFVTSLTKSNFRLSDQGVEQRLISVSLEDAPVSLGIVFDASGSMDNIIPLARQAIRAPLEAANPQDEYFIVQVHDRPKLALDFITAPEAVLESIGATVAGGHTALLDAVYFAAQYAKRGRNPRKALLVITDGRDNNSRYSRRELLRLLQESAVTLYAVGLNIREPVSENRVPPEAELLEDLARATGGRYLEAQTAADLPDVMRNFDIRYQYVLGYQPSSSMLDGRYHKVKVRIENAPGMRAWWRPGYFAAGR